MVLQVGQTYTCIMNGQPELWTVVTSVSIKGTELSYLAYCTCIAGTSGVRVWREFSKDGVCYNRQLTEPKKTYWGVVFNGHSIARSNVLSCVTDQEGSRFSSEEDAKLYVNSYNCRVISTFSYEL